MKCYVCSKKVKHSYLCKEHADLLYEMLMTNTGKIDSPDWRYHCSICGEHENRVIIDLPNSGFYCDIDIIDAQQRYNQ